MFFSRGGWVLGTLAVTSVVLIAPGAGTAAQAATGPDFPRAMVAMASLLQLSVACWVLLMIVTAQSSLRIVRGITPELMRRTLFAGAAGALVLTPVQAERSTSPIRHQLDGLRLPDRPVTSDQVTVRAGDTLWAIAERSLPPSASNSEIATSCARWYAANRDVIGSDPNLIHPKQRLTPPTKTPPIKDVP